MKKTMAWIMAAAMCLTATACGSTVSSTVSTAGSTVEGAFNLGLICPLSGSSAVSGQIMQNATKMAVDEINAAGGINGTIPINLVSVDDEGVPATSVTAMQKLVEQDKVNAVIGAQASSCTLANMEITKAAKIPQITPASSNVAVTQSGNDYIYQLTATDELHMRNVMGYMVDENNAKTFAILYESSDFGTGGFKIASTVCDDFGLEMVDSEVYNSGDTDFSVPLADAQSKGAELVFLPMYYQPASLIFAQAKSMGYAPDWFGVDGMDGILTLDGFDVALAEDVMLLTPFNADSSDERTQAFVQKYQEQYGEVPNQFAADAYDCVYAYKQALETAGATPDMDAATLCDLMIQQFTSMTFDGLTGTGMTWDTNGRVSKDPKGMVIKDGAYVGLD